MSKVVIIGGGASGLFAAYSSALHGNDTILFEKNEKLGKKIYITGKGRCNLTTSAPLNDFFNNIVSNPKFMFGALNTFNSKDVIAFFETYGLKLKEERGNRIFPESDKASDVTKTIEKVLLDLGVDIRLNTEVYDLIIGNNCVLGVKTTYGDILSDAVIVCTGGISYPKTGSTGDGYKFAKSVGHSIITPRPALVGIELCGADYLEMQGLSLKNTKLVAKCGSKIVFEDFGEMLFTHFGVSGPIVLSCSSKINRLDNVDLIIDLKPALDEETLNKRMLRELSENKGKAISNIMRSLLPKALIPCVLKQAGINIDINASELKTQFRKNIVYALKNLKFKVKKLRPIEEAIVTAGGVNVREINPKTMESKIISNLYFAGEVIDVDAFTGGYNLQLAFSTGYVAGANC